MPNPRGPNRMTMTPEQCATYELWLQTFTTLPDFLSADGSDAAGASRAHFRVLGPRVGARVPVRGAAAGPDAPLAPRRQQYADSFIDHPAMSWVQQNLPEELQVVYRLSSDCADVVSLLWHVWLFAHQRTETYRLGSASRSLGGGAGATQAVRDAHLQTFITMELSSANVETLINPYLHTDGTVLRGGAEVGPRLHAGDVVVWRHQAVTGTNPTPTLTGRRTGGHAQTLERVERDAAGGLVLVSALQGNQPIFRSQAVDIIANTGRGEERALRDAPGRRIERSDVPVTALTDMMCSGGTRGCVWTDIDSTSSTLVEYTTLVAAGPPSTARRPATGSARDVTQWVAELEATARSIASLPHTRLLERQEELMGELEAALYELRADIEGGVLTSATARASGERIAEAAGNSLWTIACQAARKDDTGFVGHHDPLYRLRAAIRAFGGVFPPMLAAQNVPSGADVRTTFTALDDVFHRAARGARTVSTTRRTTRGTPVRVLLTGFDPFSGGSSDVPTPPFWNPSGAAVMSLDGTTNTVQRTSVLIEALVMPVSFSDFRAGIVERCVDPLLADFDAILTVSLDANLQPTDPCRIEQIAVGVHDQTNLWVHALMEEELQSGIEAIPPLTMGSVTVPAGPPLIRANVDVSAVAAAAAGAVGRRTVQQPAIGVETQLRFNTSALAQSAATALSAAVPGTTGVQAPVGSREVSITDVRVLDVVVQNASWSSGAGGEFQFQVGGTTFAASLLRGPGGDFLSNEIAYRVQRLIRARGRNILSFHVHVPPANWSAIPPHGSMKRRDYATLPAVESATRAAVANNLVPTLSRIVDAVAQQVIAARP